MNLGLTSIGQGAGLLRVVLVLLLAAVACPVRADDIVKFPQPPNFARYAYHYDLLEEALKRTVVEYGPYTTQPYAVPLSTDRITTELSKGAAGPEAMIADGSLDALFDRHFGRTIADLKLDRRTVITMENPFLPTWVPLDRKELWF